MTAKTHRPNHQGYPDYLTPSQQQDKWQRQHNTVMREMNRMFPRERVWRYSGRGPT